MGTYRISTSHCSLDRSPAGRGSGILRHRAPGQAHTLLLVPHGLPRHSPASRSDCACPTKCAEAYRPPIGTRVEPLAPLFLPAALVLIPVVFQLTLLAIGVSLQEAADAGARQAVRALLLL